MKRGNRPIPGGLVLYFLDTEQFNDLFHWRLGRKEGESQRMTLHADTGISYARQILAEEKVKDRKSGKTKWEPKSSANHLLDCEVYASACADPEWAPSLSYIVGNQPKKAAQTPQKKDLTARVCSDDKRRRPGWYNNR